MIESLELFAGAFLYTHIDTEGLMLGIPLDTVSQLRASTKRQLIVAGGIATSEQIDQLDALRIDAVVGMAIYTGRVKLDSSISRLRPDHSKE
jgi:phosphoribosylformimino-5-aminoimidazole carboxamide ribotide isomerase